jgi:hypothetical protein
MPAKTSKKSYSKHITRVRDLIFRVEDLGPEKQVLFRGQDCNAPLLPKVARNDPTNDTSDQERNMIQELRHRATMDPNIFGKDDWDCLVYAQHFGMVTRLLDWTTNPLVALWFAVKDLKQDKSGYVYMLPVVDELLLDKQNEKESDPFSIGKTRVLKPNVNNPRIAAQNGWFTAHRFSRKAKKFVPLEKNSDIKRRIVVVEVPGDNRNEILKDLDMLGVNHESVFPEIEGTCRHLNWIFTVKDALSCDTG